MDGLALTNAEVKGAENGIANITYFVFSWPTDQSQLAAMCENFIMPLLPSGLKLSISQDALFHHGGNWFTCPDGDFWYWAADAQIMGPGPYELGSEIVQSAEHAPAPKTMEDVKKFIYILECEDDEKWG